MSFLTIGILHGASYSAIGYGPTLGEAKNEALVALASQLSSRVRSTQRIVIKEATTGKRSEETQLFLHDARVDTSLELLGVRLGEGTCGVDGRYQINAFLDEQALPLYLGALGEVKRYIDDIERREIVLLSFDEQQMLLLQLLKLYEEFEAYATISRALDDRAVVPELVRTKAGVELDYWNLLSQEAEALQLERTQLQAALANTQMRDAASLQLQAVMVEINKNQAAQHLWQQEQVRQQQESLERTGIQIQAIALEMQQRAEQAVRRATSEQQHQDPLAQISALEQKKQAYKAIETDVIEQIAQQKQQIEQRYVTIIEQERERPYRAGELLAGRPTETAETVRLQRIDDIRRIQDDEIVQMERQLRNSASPALQQLEKEIVDGYKHLEKTTFTLDSLHNSVMIKVGVYNGMRNSWPVAIRLSIMDQTLPIDLYVPYESMTGQKLPNLSVETEQRYEEYNQYLDIVDLFEAYFSTTAEVALNGSCTYRIYVGENPSEYGVVVEAVTLYRSDTGETVYSHQDTRAMEQVMYYHYLPATTMDEWYTSPLVRYQKNKQQKAEKARSKTERQESLLALMRNEDINPVEMLMLTAGLTVEKLERATVLYPITVGLEGTFQIPKNNAFRLGIGMESTLGADGVEYYLLGIAELVFPVHVFPEKKSRKEVGLLGFIRSVAGLAYIMDATDDSCFKGQGVLATGFRLATSSMWFEQRLSWTLTGQHQGKFTLTGGVGIDLDRW